MGPQKVGRLGPALVGQGRQASRKPLNFADDFLAKDGRCVVKTTQGILLNQRLTLTLTFHGPKWENKRSKVWFAQLSLERDNERR